MASSKLSLINNALILIGDRPLTSLTDGTRAQIAATNLYDNVVENELSKHRWGFARKKIEISKDVAAPVGDEWQTTYTLPADMITLIKLEPLIKYQILGDKVYCNYSGTLYAEYIHKPSEGDWPPYFCKMVEYALGMDFAPSIRDSATSMDLLAGQYQNASRMARYTDSQQHPQSSIAYRPFIDVRF
ncbi:MAG: hypothetical protein GWO08_00350 [Gammaproteobacteria bacterium]|nr:hypothetical protein [Gammaproteobacteria bacterium]